MSTIRSRVILDVVTARLRVGDIEGAIDAIQVDPAAFGVLERSLQEAFADGGEAMVDELPNLRRPDGPAVVWNFSVRNLEAERLIREQSSTLVTRITEDQRQGLRVAFSEGLARGDNPTRTALDVVGRVSRVTGRREGGFIGLNEQQIRFVQEARSILSDPDRIGEYLRWDRSQERYVAKYGRTQKRFFREILKAQKQGKALDEQTLGRLLTALKNSYLKDRGDAIGRTETLAALSQARENAMQQQIQSGKIRAEEVTAAWDAVGDDRTRHTHMVMDGQPRGADGYFTSPSGARLRYPHDPLAPAFETVMCRCRLRYDIDFIAAGLRKYRARVNG